MGFRDTVIETTIGIIIGAIISFLSTSIEFLPNREAIVAVIQIAPILAFIRDVEIIKNIPWTSALGYFLVVSILGPAFMLDWELGLQVILFLVYVFGKIR